MTNTEQTNAKEFESPALGAMLCACVRETERERYAHRWISLWHGRANEKKSIGPFRVNTHTHLIYVYTQIM